MAGKKRTRKAEEDASKKKQKATDEDETFPTEAAAEPVRVAAPPVEQPVAPVPAIKKSPPARKSPARKSQAEDVTVDNPYDKLVASKAETPLKMPVPLVHPADTAKGTKTEPVREETIKVNEMIKSQEMHADVMKATVKHRTISSVPCVLLFLVAFLLWCSVTLLGLVLSERMDHELQMWQLRQMLMKSESVATPLPPGVHELQKDVNHWKGVAGKLESQKKGMLKEFGEKIANLELML